MSHWSSRKVRKVVRIGRFIRRCRCQDEKKKNMSFSYGLEGGRGSITTALVRAMAKGTFTSRKPPSRDEKKMKVGLLAVRIYATDRQTGRVLIKISWTVFDPLDANIRDKCVFINDLWYDGKALSLTKKKNIPFLPPLSFFLLAFVFFLHFFFLLSFIPSFSPTFFYTASIKRVSF